MPSFGGCGIGRDLKPFSVSTASGPDLVGPGGGLLLAGLASDQVAHLELFLPHGRQQVVPLKDNAFVVRVRGSDPVANLVAYDKHGLVIGTTTARHVVLTH
jgi:hypothetical protein